MWSFIFNIKPGIVKEQRVDGSWCNNKKLLRLRCTLMGFERNYQLRILSNQINAVRMYTNLSQKPYMNPWFFTGFSDAESSFY